MLRSGPVPLVLHGLVEYGAGILLIVAPFLFGFDSNAATAVSIGVGLVLLVVGAVTAGPTGILSSLPLGAHVAFDYVLAVFLIVSPYLFGLSEEAAPTAFFIALGIAHLLLTIATRFRPQPKTRRATVRG